MVKRVVLACVVAAAIAAAAISGATAIAGDVHGAATVTKRTITADPNGNLKFNTTRLSARRGIVSIVMRNPSTSGLDHGVAIKGNGVSRKGSTVHPGSSSSVRLRLKPGTYTFYCPVPGHAASGMKGRLTVK